MHPKRNDDTETLRGLDAAAGTNTSSSQPIRRVPSTIRLSRFSLSGLVSQSPIGGSQSKPALTSIGLLFGSVNGRELNVEALRCFRVLERSQPDSIAVSESEFEQCLSASKDDPELRALALIGWYRLQRKGDTRLLDEDAGFHNLHFRRISDVALMLNGDSQAMSLAFYTRWPNAPMSNERHRFASISKIDGTSITEPIELALRAKFTNEYQKRVYQVLDSMQEAQRTGKAISFAGPSGMSEPGQGGPEKKDDGAPPRKSGHVPDASRPPESFPGQQPSTESPFLHPSPKEGKGRPWLRLKANVWATPVIAFTLCGVGVCTWLYVRDRRPAIQKLLGTDASEEKLTSLGLRVRMQGDELLVTWNRRNERIRAAKDGALEIIDGPEHREVHLDASEIARASVVYRPLSPDMIIRLTLSGANEVTDSEEVRVLRGAKGGAGLQTTNVRSHILAKARSEVQAPAHSPAPRTAPPPAASKSLLPTAVQSPQGKQVASIGQRVGKQAAGMQSNNAISQTSGKTLDSGLASPASHLRVSQPPVVARSPAGAAVAGVRPVPAYVPPQPITRVMPSGLPAGLLTKNPVQIDIQVRIDETGRVIDARPANDAFEVNERLTRAALAAAREWTFQPAIVKGRQVACDHIIEFRLTPERE